MAKKRKSLGNRFNPKAFGLALGILWGLGVLVLTLAAIYFNYGNAFLALLSSMYIGLSLTLKGAIIGGVWGFIDGFIGGYIFAWLYNKCLKY